MTRARDISNVITDADLAGDIDVDGTTNLDVVDIDGALTQDGGAVFNEDSADVDFRVESNGEANMLVVDGGNNAVVIGESAPDTTVSGGTPAFQVIGSAFDSFMSLTRRVASASAPVLGLTKSRNTSVGSHTIVQDGDTIGEINFFADDGTDFDSRVATIKAQVDGTPGANDTPGRLVFMTTADGSNSPTERMRIDSNGNVGIGTTTPGSFNTLADNLVVGTTSGENGITIASGSGNSGRFVFSDNTTSSNDAFVGAMEYSHGSNAMMIYTAGTQRLLIGNDGATKITSLAGSNYVLRLHNDRNNNDGYGLHLQVGADDPSGTHYQIDFADGDGTLQGSISSNNGTVNYGAFTAFHPCIIPNTDNDADSVANAYPYGTLLEVTSLSYTQKNGANTERGILYNVQKSSSAKSKAVLGAYGSSMNSEERGSTNLHQALVLGDGHILCNNENGNIAVGDYICTSSTTGEGMKATSICATIGIAREAVTFSNSTAKLVAVEYGYRQFIPEDIEARIKALENAE